MRALVLAGMVALAAACTEEGAGPSDPSQNPDQAAAAIARPALRVRRRSMARSTGTLRAPIFPSAPPTRRSPIQTAGQDGPSPVPMLLPSGIVAAQSADQRPTIPVVTKDGYFATYHLPRYDAIVNGSQRAIASGQAAQGDKEAMKFTTGEASAQLAFSRYGADYVIEFECREVDGARELHQRAGGEGIRRKPVRCADSLEDSGSPEGRDRVGCVRVEWGEAG